MVVLLSPRRDYSKKPNEDLPSSRKCSEAAAISAKNLALAFVQTEILEHEKNQGITLNTVTCLATIQRTVSPKAFTAKAKKFITPKTTDETLRQNAQLNDSNDLQSLFPNTGKRKRESESHRGSGPKEIQILPIGADELMKKIRIMQRSKRVGAVAIWLRRAFAQFDNDGNNVIDQVEFNQDINQIVAFTPEKRCRIWRH